MIGIFITLMFMTMLTASVLGLIAYTFRPLLSVDGRHVGPDHYTVADTACLTVYVAALVALAKAVVPVATELRGTAMVFAMCVAVVMWWGAVRVLSRAMVGRPSKRITFMLVVPLALLFAVVIVGAPFAGFIKFVQLRNTADQISLVMALVAVVVSMIGSGVILSGLNRLTMWIVRHDEFSNRVGGPTPIDFHAPDVNRLDGEISGDNGKT